MSAEHDALMFGRNLFLARRRCGLSQEALALRAGMSRDGIYKIEMGLRSPRLDTIWRLALALDVKPGELIDGLRR